MFLARAGDIVGPNKRVVEIELPEGATLKDLIDSIREKVSKRIGEGILNGRLIFTVIVNGVEVIDLNYELRDGDHVIFTAPEMGG
jgi:molybdopterin converting factor small subunit